MDLVSGCKTKLVQFRVKELKEVLTQLGLSKQGRKQDLMDRILDLFSVEQDSRSNSCGKRSTIGKEGLAKIIDDTYRKMQAPGAIDLVPKNHSSSDFSHKKPKEEVLDDAYKFLAKVRCPCGSSLVSESMVQCQGPRCQVRQHIGCVVIPEKPMEGVQLETPDQFYCELCRISKADPFWVTMGHPLLPVKMTLSGTTTDGTTTTQIVEKTFPLSKADKEMFQRTECDIQVWCILLNDKVPFRMQWPQNADLNINGIPVRTTNRPGSQLLGINGRDDGPVISAYGREGINKISFSRTDARTFCFGIRIVKRRTVQEVLNLVPKEADGEHFEYALSRVQRCIGGGTDAENAGSDSDLEVVSDSVTVNLRCPMSGSRMRIAGRFKPCIHMGCFDLETFVELNQRSRKWQCPICLKNYSLESIIIDPYFNRITSLMQICGEDINEIEVKPDGSWRAKCGGERKDLSQWHYPDGSLCSTTKAEVKPELDVSRKIKLEGSSEGHMGLLKIGIKRNRDGRWEVSKADGTRHPSSGNHVLETFENNCQNIVHMSSSATGSNRDGEDPSVNQEGATHFDFSLNNSNELESFRANFDSIYKVEDGAPAAPLKDSDIIVLSDSEENVTIISPEPVHDTAPADGNGITFASNHSVISERYIEDIGLGTTSTSCTNLFNNGSDDFEIPLWQMETGSGFQLFGTGANVPGGLVDAQGSFACASTSGYDFDGDGGLGDDLNGQNICIPDSYSDMNGSLVDNPLAFGGDDPSLQIFLPSEPEAGPHSGITDRNEISYRSQPEDWISLSLGAGEIQSDSASVNGLNPQQQYTLKKRRMDSSQDTASMFSNINDERTNKSSSNNQQSDINPHQPSSVSPQLVLSVDSDSD